MKLTEQDKNLFKETHSKWVNEAGWLANLFVRRASNNLKNDKSIQKAISDADKFTEKSKNKISNLFKGNKEEIKKALPSKDLRKSLGFDF